MHAKITRICSTWEYNRPVYYAHLFDNKDMLLLPDPNIVKIGDTVEILDTERFKIADRKYIKGIIEVYDPETDSS